MISSPIEEDPQYPYASVMVRASAGSGKTYQLARRFLCLVATGVPPESILTLTFTQKAAQEMRSRVLNYARELAANPQNAQQWSQRLEDYYNYAVDQEWARGASTPARPRSPTEVSQAILAQASRLQISTIDSLFGTWVKRFTLETKSSHLSEIVEVLSTFEQKDMQARAWQDLFPPPPAITTQNNMQARARELISSPHLKNLPLTRINSMCLKLDSFCLLSAESWGDITPASHHLKHHWQRCYRELESKYLKAAEPPSHPNHTRDPWLLSESARETWLENIDSCLYAYHLDDIKLIVSAVKSPEDYEEIVATGDLRALIASPLITKSTRQVSAQKISRSKRDKYPDVGAAVERLDRALELRQDTLNLMMMIPATAELIELSRLWKSCLHMRQKAQQRWSYDDITLAVGRLLTSDDPDSLGAFYQIQRPLRHLMIDELQDTNAAQWHIFQSLAAEMVSALGDEGLPRTVFWVGDEKQCLYGFRQAHPLVMDYAEHWMRRHGGYIVSLDTSYRSHEVVLEFINSVFHREDTQITRYRSMIPGPLPLLRQKGRGRVEILPLAIGDEAVKLEAEIVADRLCEILSSSADYPIGDLGHPIVPSDVVVLYRQSTHSAVFERALQERNIPTTVSGRAEDEFYGSCEIADLCALWKWLIEPSDQISFLSLCKSPIVALSDAQISWLVAGRRYEGAFSILLIALTALKNLSIEYLLADSSPFPLDDDRPRFDRKSLSRAIHVLEHLKAFVDDQDASPFALRFLALLDDLQVKQVYLQAWPDAEGKRAKRHVEILAEAIAQWSVDDHATPAQIYDFFLAHRSPPGAGSEGAGGQGAVTLMTIHKSKGLEFPLVCLTQSEDRWYQLKDDWYSLAQSSNSAHAPGEYAESETTAMSFDILPQALFEKPVTIGFKQQMDKALRDKLYKESLRLLYVALSRSSQYVLISGNAKTSPKETTKKSSERSRDDDGQPKFYSVLRACCESLSLKNKLSSSPFTVSPEGFVEADRYHPKNDKLSPWLTKGDVQKPSHPQNIPPTGDLLSDVNESFLKVADLEYKVRCGRVERLIERPHASSWMSPLNDDHDQIRSRGEWAFEADRAEINKDKTEDHEQKISPLQLSYPQLRGEGDSLKSLPELTGRQKVLWGTYIHLILEESCRQRSYVLPHDDLVNSLCSVEEEQALPQGFWQRAEEEAEKSFAVIHPRLIKARQVHCEVPLAGHRELEQTGAEHSSSGDLSQYAAIGAGAESNDSPQSREREREAVMIIGTADLVLEYGGLIEIIDWKSHVAAEEYRSGQAKKRFESFSHQLRLYKSCLQEGNPRDYADRSPVKVRCYVFLTASAQLVEV